MEYIKIKMYLCCHKLLIMEQTLFIVFAVIIVFALLYRWKKKKENRMGNDLNTLIEANDCVACVASCVRN